ncbi:MAG: 2-hydroxyacid dehydrogenase [Oscillospiraceae bacterium]|nr:2-hydroxyacid dehydrogenase [Oscillospiraceae bacterium]
MQTVCFDTKPYDLPGLTKYGEEAGVSFRFLETKLNAHTAALAEECGAKAVCIFVNDRADRAAIDRLCSAGVKLIALRCAGVNNVDMAYAEGKISVIRVPGYSPHAVAEHAMGMLLSSVRHLHKAYARTRDFNFSLRGLTGIELYGKTVGVVGTGRIGRVFAELCRGFGMRVLAYDKFPDPASGLCYVPLEQLLAESDVISLHCPLTEDTRHLIGRESISTMKPGVVLLNTSRGALVDTAALLEGIKSRRIGAACMDVYEEEADVFFEDRSDDILQDDTLARLLSMPNVLVTSHQAFLTREALDTIARETCFGIRRFFEGEKEKMRGTS